jgi:hypothetical protein
MLSVAMRADLRHSLGNSSAKDRDWGVSEGGLAMPNLEFATGTFALPIWAGGAAAALFVVIGVLTLRRAGASLAGALVRAAAFAAILAALWLTLDRAELRERSAERRALDQRAAELTMRAIAPASALACLDAVAGDAVETACEKAVFASPQSIAAAVSYVSARLVLLADGADFARRTGSAYEGALATSRLALETDRFGIVAHVLSVRDSCTPLLCDSYALLHDPDRVQANLRERVFDRYIERYTAEWAARAQKPGPPLAEGPNGYTTASGPPAAAATAAAVPVSPKYDFPSASSIPPVSIMNAEPGMPAETKPAPSAAAPAAAPPKRPAPRAARATPAPPPPQQIAPAASAGPAPAAPAAAVR